MSYREAPHFKNSLSDFTVGPRLLLIAAMAMIVGTFGTAAAWVLLRMIALFTNLAYFQRLSLEIPTFPTTLPLWSVAIPAVGGLIIGMMALISLRRKVGSGRNDDAEIHGARNH
jgi:CIC family chloride channel protein